MSEIERVAEFVRIHGLGRRLDQVASTGMGAALNVSDIAALLADRQHWINVAAKMGNIEARALATEGWVKP